MPVQFKSLVIERKGYSNTGPFSAKLKVSWDDRDNVMNVEIDEELTKQIVALIAPSVTEAAAREMQNFVMQLEEATQPLIEAAPVVPVVKAEDDDIPF